MEITETQTIPDKKWCNNKSSFKGTKVVEVIDGEEQKELRLEFGFSEKYGRRRRSIKVKEAGSRKAIMTFFGGDRWGQNQTVLGKIRNPEGRGYLTDLRDLDEDTKGFRTRRLRRFIRPTPGRRVEACWAIRAPETDLKTLVKAALAFGSD